MSLEQVYRLADDATFEAVNDGAVILTFGDGQLYSCNETSTAFLSALDGTRSLAAVAELMAAEFEVSHDELAADLTQLADEMVSEGIIIGVT